MRPPEAATRAPAGAARTVVASAYAAEARELRARVTEFDRGERLGRATRVFFPLLAGALLTLPIPALHLATVPALSLAAVFLGARRLREFSRVDSLEGPCPACGREPRWPSGVLHFPLKRPCAECGEFVTLSERRGAKISADERLDSTR